MHRTVAAEQLQPPQQSSAVATVQNGLRRNRTASSTKRCQRRSGTSPRSRSGSRRAKVLGPGARNRPVCRFADCGFSLIGPLLPRSRSAVAPALASSAAIAPPCRGQARRDPGCRGSGGCSGPSAPSRNNCSRREVLKMLCAPPSVSALRVMPDTASPTRYFARYSAAVALSVSPSVSQGQAE